MIGMFKAKRRIPALFGVIFFLILLAGVVALIRLYEFEKPQISLLSDVSLLGDAADVTVALSDEKSGIQEFSVFISQGQKRFKVHERKFVRQGYLLNAGETKLEETFTIDTNNMGFDDGRADILIEVRDFSFWNWMKGNTITSSYPVVLDTKVPKIWLLDSPEAIKPGSSGVIIYRVSEPITGHGVEIDGFIHSGFPVPGRGEDIYGALIGIPHNKASVKKATIFAYDRAGNRGNTGFGVHLRKVREKTDRINVSEGFLNKKMPEFNQYYPEIQDLSSQLEQYLFVNQQVRKMNADEILNMCKDSAPEQLWEGRFKRMRRSSRRAGFADYRSYYFQGKKIDNQVHLGIDLASVRRANVEAANRGVVVFADYLGIYGNMVVVDHGIGVFSLYSHMSQIHVKVGDQVEKSATLGNTGVSGMAGGDHLHFSMLVNGVFVNPLEWWDSSWLELNILNYLKGTSQD